MRFLVDLMCGGVLAYLRMCGHDTAYAGDRGLEADEQVVAAARSEDRIVVTRDVALADRADESILLSSRDVEDQLAELVDADVDLELADEPTRCGNCNGELARVRRSSLGPDLSPDDAPDPADEPVWECTDCGQWFWRGSHWDRVRETLAAIDGTGVEE